MESIFIGGAEGYLGRHCVLHFLKAGYAVSGSVWKMALADELKSWLGANGGDLKRLFLHGANLSVESETARLVGEIGKYSPRMHRFVNCVGGFEWVKVTDATRDQVDFLMQANFYGNWLLLKHWLPMLTKQKAGKIALVSAAASTKPVAVGMGPYIASKAALNAMVQAAQEETKGSGVHIEAVYPTIIDTPRNRADMPTANFSEWMTPAQVIEKISAIVV